jgi:hypothetical protein
MVRVAKEFITEHYCRWEEDARCFTNYMEFCDWLIRAIQRDSPFYQAIISGRLTLHQVSVTCRDAPQT